MRTLTILAAFALSLLPTRAGEAGWLFHRREKQSFSYHYQARSHVRVQSHGFFGDGGCASGHCGGVQAVVVPSSQSVAPQSPVVPSKQQPVPPAKSTPASPQSSPDATQLVPPPSDVAPPPPKAEASIEPACDPWGFLVLINAERARLRLPILTYDPVLADFAQQNNLYQIVYKYPSHHIFAPGAGQAADFGPFDINQTYQRWLNSPGHRAILMNNSASRIGIDGRLAVGGERAWTANVK